MSKIHSKCAMFALVSYLLIRGSVADEPLTVREIKVRFIDPLAETAIAVSAKDLMTPAIGDPISEMRLTDPKIQKIANEILTDSKIGRSSKRVGDFAYDSIDTRVVFEFVTEDKVTWRLAYGYPNVTAWVNVDAPALQKDALTRLLSLLPHYVVKDILDAQK